MWRVDGCFIYGCVFWCWRCRPDVSVIPSEFAFFFQSQFLALSLWIFDLSLLVGDKYFWSDSKWNCHLVIGLRQDL